jgi:hypothetical protein
MCEEVPRPEVGSRGLSPGQITVALNRRFRAAHQDLHVDPVFLGHALPQYKTVLEARLGWTLERTFEAEFFTPAIGGLAQKQFGFRVKFSPNPNPLCPGRDGWTHQYLAAQV